MAPEGWARATIKAVVDPARKVTYGIVQPGPRQEHGIPIIRGKDYSAGRVDDSGLYRVRHDIAARYERSKVRGGDILLSIVGYLGQVAMVPSHLEGANITQTTARIAIAPPNLPEFFLQQLQSSRFKKQVERFQKGSAQPGLNLADVEKMEVLVPPPDVQRRIAAILSAVDNVIERTREVISGLDNLLQVTRKALVRNGLPPVVSALRWTEIGAVPSSWRVSSLEAVAEVLDSARRPLNSTERRDMRGPYPYYGANGVVDHIDRWLFDEPLLLMAEDGGYFDEYERRHIAYRVAGKCWVNNHAHVLRPRPGVELGWLYWCLVHEDIRPYINSGTRSKLNQSDMRQIPVPIPPVDEQRRMTAVLDAIENRRGAEVATLAELGFFKSALAEGLLSGDVRAQGGLGSAV